MILEQGEIYVVDTWLCCFYDSLYKGQSFYLDKGDIVILLKKKREPLSISCDYTAVCKHGMIWFSIIDDFINDRLRKPT